jgi:TldD protein
VPSWRHLKEQAPLPYVDHFGLSAADLRGVLGLALSSGANSPRPMEHRTYDFINMEEDIIKETAEAVACLGIRVIRGDRTDSATRTTSPWTRSAKRP